MNFVAIYDPRREIELMIAELICSGFERAA